jgi:hypothetical protein
MSDGAPTLQWLVAALLAAGAVVASLRLAALAHAGHLPSRQAAPIMLLQCLAALLLYHALYPPPAAGEARVLTVLTADADPRGARGLVVALPEFLGQVGERAPDLATALRRSPESAVLVIRGQGLTPRDLDAARAAALALEFEPAPLPPGLVELHLPEHVTAGLQWRLHGRVTAPSGRVELYDPAGALAGEAVPGADGRFALAALARAPGPTEFELRVLDGESHEIERVVVPVPVLAGASPRVLLLAGAPGPELRFLRRWAVDAGIELETRVQLSREVGLGGLPKVDPTALAGYDLLVLDERVWGGMDAGARAGLRDAIREGLGVLLRIGAALDEDERRALADFGFLVERLEREDLSVRLAPGPGVPATALTRRPVTVIAPDAAVLLRSDADEPLALWRAERRGRIALWWLDDSYRLALSGEPAAFASLWSRTAATLGRASASANPEAGPDHGMHRRRVLCGVAPGAQVREPSGRLVPLAIDRGCASYWPAQPGWHELPGRDGVVPFHVRSAAHAGLAVGASQAATRELAAGPRRVAAGDATPAPGSPWPFYLGWLLAMTACWWLERRHRR